MITTFDNLYERELVRLVEEARMQRAATLTSGNAADYAEYREHVGWIKALDWILAQAPEVRRKIYGELG